MIFKLQNADFGSTIINKDSSVELVDTPPYFLALFYYCEFRNNLVITSHNFRGGQ